MSLSKYLEGVLYEYLDWIQIFEYSLYTHVHNVTTYKQRIHEICS